MTDMLLPDGDYEVIVEETSLRVVGDGHSQAYIGRSRLIYGREYVLLRLRVVTGDHVDRIAWVSLVPWSPLYLSNLTALGIPEDQVPLLIPAGVAGLVFERRVTARVRRNFVPYLGETRNYVERLLPTVMSEDEDDKT